MSSAGRKWGWVTFASASVVALSWWVFVNVRKEDVRYMSPVELKAMLPLGTPRGQALRVLGLPEHDKLTRENHGYHDDDECYIITGWANRWSMIRTQREYILQFDADNRLASVFMNTVFLGEEDGEYLTYP